MWLRKYGRDVSCDRCKGGRKGIRLNILAVSTMNYKDYHSNGGNVSVARVNEFRRRTLAPHGNGEVVLKNEFGKITDKQVINY